MKRYVSIFRESVGPGFMSPLASRGSLGDTSRIKTSKIVAIVNDIDQHTMGSRDKRHNQWQNKAEDLLGSYNISDWDSLEKEAGSNVLGDLIKYAFDLKIIGKKGIIG